MRSYLLILLVLLFCFDGVLCSLVAKRANLSSKRDAVGGIRAGDRFYFPGGFESHDYLPTSIVDIYNITSGEWEEPIYLSEPRGFVSTTVIGDNIYFVGGTRILNCALLYNMTLSVYERIGCGPTVRTPIQVSNHDSTVTVLGYFSADFFSINTSEWYHYPNLTSWMQNIVGGITVVHENLVIGLGGVNVTTSAPLHDAWIFDTSTQEFTIFEDATVMDIVNYQFNHLHSNNIVHRDVAARNVLVHRNEPKLTDFGMSRLVEDRKQHGTTKSELGPIRWMAPESLKNKEYSTKSDVWSFGILMFEVVTRQEPHSDADPIEIGRLIRDQGLTPVIPLSCNSELSELMKQCWKMSPQSRPTLDSIIHSLESIEQQQ